MSKSGLKSVEKKSVPLGRWKRAPLAYVIAAINTSEIPNIANKVAGVQERLASQFPELVAGNSSTLAVVEGALVPSSARPVWELINDTQDLSVVIRSDLIALQATAYTGFEQFFEVARIVFAAISINVSRFVVKRSGLRYVDIIVPQAGKSPDDYVHERLRGAPLGSFPGRTVTVQSTTEHNFSEAAKLRVTYARMHKKRGEPFFPPGIDSRHLRNSDVMQESIEHEGDVGILDFDRSHEDRNVFDVALVMGRLKEFHKDQQRAIREVATAEALSEWGADRAIANAI